MQATELAVLALNYGTPISIDGFNVSPMEYQLVALKPGSYRIDHGFFYSVVSEEDKSNITKPDPGCTNEPADFKKGERYRVVAATVREDRGLRITQESTGAVVWRCRER